MASFNFDCESKDARPVTKADQNIGSANVDFEFHPTRNNLSPIVPVRLSRHFIDEVGFSFFVIYVWGLFLVHLCHGMSFLMERNELFLVYLIGSIFFVSACRSTKFSVRNMCLKGFLTLMCLLLNRLFSQLFSLLSFSSSFIYLFILVISPHLLISFCSISGLCLTGDDSSFQHFKVSSGIPIKSC